LEELLTKLKSDGMLSEEEWAYRMPNSDGQEGAEQTDNGHDDDADDASSEEDTDEGQDGLQ